MLNKSGQLLIISMEMISHLMYMLSHLTNMLSHSIEWVSMFVEWLSMFVRRLIIISHLPLLSIIYILQAYIADIGLYTKWGQYYCL